MVTTTHTAVDPIRTIVVAREGSIERTTEAKTPGQLPNILAVAIPPLQAILTRAARVYVQSLIAFLTAGGSGVLDRILPNEFGGLFYTAAMLAVGPAVISVLHNSLELLIKLDETHPSFRA